MKFFILEIFLRLIDLVLNFTWFLIRPMVYLYMIWASIKIMILFLSL